MLTVYQYSTVYVNRLQCMLVVHISSILRKNEDHLPLYCKITKFGESGSGIEVLHNRKFLMKVIFKNPDDLQKYNFRYFQSESLNSIFEVYRQN